MDCRSSAAFNKHRVTPLFLFAYLSKANSVPALLPVITLDFSYSCAVYPEFSEEPSAAGATTHSDSSIPRHAASPCRCKYAEINSKGACRVLGTPRNSSPPAAVAEDPHLYIQPDCDGGCAPPFPRLGVQEASAQPEVQAAALARALALAAPTTSSKSKSSGWCHVLLDMPSPQSHSADQGSSRGGPRSGFSWGPYAVRTRVLQAIVGLLVTTLFFSVYWLSLPRMPSLQSDGGVQLGTPAVYEGAREAAIDVWSAAGNYRSRTLGASLTTETAFDGGPLGISEETFERGPSPPSREAKTVWFPSPTIGFSEDAPFTFDPMRALSAPASAFSFIKETPQKRGAPVELYAVVHACTQTIPYPRIPRGFPQRGPHWGPPFVQGLQSAGQSLLLQSSGLYGRSYLRELRLTSETRRQGEQKAGTRMLMERVFFLSNNHFAEGFSLYYSTVLQRLLVLVLTWESNTVYAIDYETLECIGTFAVPQIEGWGFTSSFELALYEDLKEAQKQAAAAVAAAAASRWDAESANSTPHAPSLASNNAAAEAAAAAMAAAAAAKEDLAAAEKRLLEHAAKQQLWITTGGPELVEVSVHSIETPLAARKAELKATVKRLQEKPQQFSQQNQEESLPTITRPSPTCRTLLGSLSIRQAAVAHCLGQVLVGLNELEYNKKRQSLIANLYGLPVAVEIRPDSGECVALYSFSGVALVEQLHDETRNVSNGIAIPYERAQAPSEATSPPQEEAPRSLIISGKGWPALARVRLRRLRIGDTIGYEPRRLPWEEPDCPDSDDTDEETLPFLEVESFSALRKKVPQFLFTRQMRRQHHL
ncbi:hypothetical protein cyc_03229 [Cyclospora cayetanensis]|uniref:Uncharacterized protein n=1 Tax=Cyclospora cayetanensis TaxID=88456 RepID=A0A1D3CV60_9EIME|nr:hypothetical protein cyc_03229 [Cyclospora cayetanensis]